MSRKRTLLLHLGSHKTGSSSIQKSLYDSRNLLEQEGVTLFCQDPDGSERRSGNAITWINFRLSPSHRIDGRINRGLAEALANAGDKVVMSAETFSWVFNPRQIRRFRDALARHFSEIKLISYIRRQDEQVVSQYQQAAKYTGFVASCFYGPGNHALPRYQPHFDRYLNYSQRLGYWADAFGEENLTVRVFARDRLIENDVVADFFASTGLPWNGAPSLRNESQGLIRTKVSRLLSQHALAEHCWNTLVHNLPESPVMLPSRAQARDFHARYTASNRQLNSRFAIVPGGNLFSDDFSKYPLESTDIWDKESALQAVMGFNRGLCKLQKHDQSTTQQIQLPNPTVAIDTHFDDWLAGEISSIARANSWLRRDRSPVSRLKARIRKNPTILDWYR